MQASFNVKPPRREKCTHAWDVNIALDFLPKLGNNYAMPLNTLASKRELLILLAKMCRLSEVCDLKLSCMKWFSDSVEFTLPALTKMYYISTMRHTNLQRITLQSLPGHPQLCPVNTLHVYLEKTRPVCENVDQLFITLHDAVMHGISRQTLSR